MEKMRFNLTGSSLVDRLVPARLVGSLSGILIAMAIAWVPLLILCVIDGIAVGHKVSIPFLSDPTPYARLLISLPLFILAEIIVNKRLSAVVSYIWESGILVGDTRTRFEESIRKINHRSNSIADDIVCLLVAFTAVWIIGIESLNDGFSTWFAYDRGDGQQMAAAGWWYSLVSLPFYQYMLFRWIWRMLLWWRFLWQTSRLKLRLLPSHPDRAGGLGILGVGQNSFIILIFAMSAVLASELADVKLRDHFTLASALPTILVWLALSLLLVLGPLIVFTKQLMETKRQGLIDYGDLADDLNGAFAKKWIGKNDADQRKLLGNVDPSSLSDYGYVYEVVSAMRVVPLTLNSLTALAGATLLPFAPLLLMEKSWKEVMQQILSIVG